MEQRIGFGKRLGALCLDIVICIVLAFVGGSAIGGMLGSLGGAAAWSGAVPGGGEEAAAAAAVLGGMFGALVGFLAAYFLIWVVYFLIEGFTGYTLGKLILGIRVASADGVAAPVTKLLGRWAVKNSGTILAVLALFAGSRALSQLGNLAGLIIFVGCFFVLGTKRQAFHDMLMKTAVYPRAAIKAAV
jgi:uncharacterized RDD family membrane protein YckC